jgi:hypothetical protein
MAQAQLPVIQRGFGGTMRTDAWWVRPVIIVIVLGSFLAYANWAAWQGDHYQFGNYLSPFYSPLLFGNSSFSWFGARPAWFPAWISPALLILPFPGLFRVTCYYYRGAYYRSFWADPPGCAVGEPRSTYLGEKSFPLILQNVHRYFLYAALIFLVILTTDVWRALWFADPVTGVEHFGVGVGTIVLAVNVVLLSCYTFGCHSLRHIVGGHLDSLAGRPVRQTAYACSSCLNRKHMYWAYMSLLSVGFADIYVRLCSMGIWTDWRLF